MFNMRVDVETYMAPNGREMRIPVTTLLPETGDVDDSRLHMWVPGFGEPIEHSTQIAQALANRLGNPVGTYAQPIGGYVDRPRTDVPLIYRDGLRIALERTEQEYDNATHKDVSGHSMAGLAIGHLLEDEPDSFEVIELVKAVGTTTKHESAEGGPVSIRDQLQA